MFAARTIDAENVAPMRTGAGNFDNAKGGKVTAYAVKDQKFWSDLSQAAARDVEALEEANTCAHQWRAEAERLREQLAHALADNVAKERELEAAEARIEDAAREMARDMFVKSQIDQEALADDEDFREIMGEEEDEAAPGARAVAPREADAEEEEGEEDDEDDFVPLDHEKLRVTAAAFAAQAEKQGAGFWLELAQAAEQDVRALTRARAETDEARDLALRVAAERDGALRFARDCEGQAERLVQACEHAGGVGHAAALQVRAERAGDALRDELEHAHAAFNECANERDALRAQCGELWNAKREAEAEREAARAYFEAALAQNAAVAHAQFEADGAELMKARAALAAAWDEIAQRRGLAARDALAAAPTTFAAQESLAEDGEEEEDDDDEEDEDDEAEEEDDEEYDEEYDEGVEEEDDDDAELDEGVKEEDDDDAELDEGVEEEEDDDAGAAMRFAAAFLRADDQQALSLEPGEVLELDHARAHALFGALRARNAALTATLDEVACANDALLSERDDALARLEAVAQQFEEARARLARAEGPALENAQSTSQALFDELVSAREANATTDRALRRAQNDAAAESQRAAELENQLFLVTRWIDEDLAKEVPHAGEDDGEAEDAAVQTDEATEEAADFGAHWTSNRAPVDEATKADDDSDAQE